MSTLHRDLDDDKYNSSVEDEAYEIDDYDPNDEAYIKIVIHMLAP